MCSFVRHCQAYESSIQLNWGHHHHLTCRHRFTGALRGLFGNWNSSLFSKSHATVRHPRRMLNLLTRSSVLFLHAHRDVGSWRSRVQPLVRTARRRTIHRPGASALPTPPPLSNLTTSKDAAAARDWLIRFKGCPLPRAAVDIAFSRSSGPGGQVCPHSCFCIRVASIKQAMANRTSTK